VKLYLTPERRAALPAVCLLGVSAHRILPPSAALLWQESALAQDLVLGAVPAPSARVAVEAIGSVRVDLPVRTPVSDSQPGGKDETRTDVTSVSTTRIDEIHVASAAQLDQRGVRVQGTTGFSAKQDMTAPKPNGGVRGIPPRGRPV
jgi:hypothetical protein